MGEPTWRQITCAERDALVDELGRSYNGFSDESGVGPVYGLTDMDGQFGEPIVRTVWGYDDANLVLKDERWPQSDRPCEHYVPAEVAPMTAAGVSDLAEFLLARYGEHIRRCWELGAVPGSTFARDEYQALTEVVETLRDELANQHDPEPTTLQLADEILHMLAQPYADHSDFREEWTP